MHWRVREVIHFIEHIPWNIKRVISWIPVLWGNFDWSTTFLLEIMKKKLEYMEHYAIHHCIAVDAERDAEQIREIINLMDRVINETSESEHYARMEDIFGGTEWEFEEDEDTGLTMLGNRRYYNDGFSDEEIEFIKHQEWIRAMDKWKDEWDTMWELLRKNGLGWGD